MTNPERPLSTTNATTAASVKGLFSRPKKLLHWFSILFFLTALLSVLAVFISSTFDTAPTKHTATSQNIAATNSAIKSPPTPSAKVNPTLAAKSDWTDLTPDQQKILAPLTANWAELKPTTKSKWLEISQRYAAMSPAEQERVQERMHDWDALTPKQRQTVRENYVRNSKLDTEQRALRWMQYQQLSEEEKQKLAAQTPPQGANKNSLTRVPIIEKSIPAKPIMLTPPDPVTAPDDGLSNH